MPLSSFYLLAADVLMVLHFLFIAFVILGLFFILLGGFLRWRWVKNPIFRFSHLAAIGVVVAQSWLGLICPLTIWEMELRFLGGQPVYGGSFVAHWLERLMYFEAPTWVFTLCYTAFGVCVVIAWCAVRPRRFGSKVGSKA